MKRKSFVKRKELSRDETGDFIRHISEIRETLTQTEEFLSVKFLRENSAAPLGSGEKEAALELIKRIEADKAAADALLKTCLEIYCEEE